MIVDQILQRNVLPDSILRMGIRYLSKSRLKSESRISKSKLEGISADLFRDLSTGPMAVNTLDANEQHYEVPARFFEIVLGPQLKYSSGIWKNDKTTLEQAEIDMLELTIQRADIKNASHVLDLGCGWGSFSLFAAQKYSRKKFTAVSNSHSQRKYIQEKAELLGVKNLKVITSDINDFQPNEKFDRIVSVEMFEHIRNYKKLFENLYSWLNPKGQIFVHIFNHRQYAYKFDSQGEGDWMARHFFSGGMMPSDKLFLEFSEGFNLMGHWQINGEHYSKTLEAWLKKMDANKIEIMELFKGTYGKEADKFWVYWRIFFLACSETFLYHDGIEWGVSHYLFEKK